MDYVLGMVTCRGSGRVATIVEYSLVRRVGCCGTRDLLGVYYGCVGS